jgi:hypothetical protein
MHPIALILSLKGYRLYRFEPGVGMNTGIDKLLRIKQQTRPGEDMLSYHNLQWMRVDKLSFELEHYSELPWASIDQSILDSITDEMINALP